MEYVTWKYSEEERKTKGLIDMINNRNMVIKMEIKPQRYRLAIVFHTLFFPFTYPELIDSLKKREYSVPPPPRPAPTGQRVYVGGHIATKNGCIIDVNEEKKTLAGEGSQVENVIKSIEELMDVVEEDFRLNLERDVDYIELVSDLVVKSDKSPLKDIEGFNNKYSAFNGIMGMETSAYSISIVPKGFLPSSKKWFDIRIEPRVTTPDREYFIHAIYRDENIGDVLAFAREVNSKILSLIEKIGGK